MEVIFRKAERDKVRGKGGKKLEKTFFLHFKDFWKKRWLTLGVERSLQIFAQKIKNKKKPIKIIFTFF